MDIFGLPQPLSGNEMVTVSQIQNGNIATCSMTLSMLVAYAGPVIAATIATDIFSSLPKTEPTEPGIAWNNNGVVSIS